MDIAFLFATGWSEALEVLRDVLLAPVWALTGIDKESLAGMVVQGLAGALVTAFIGWLSWLALQALRALHRADDAKVVAKARQDAPNAVLILIADFAGEGKKAKWGDALAARLEPDFTVFAPGASVRAARWTKRYKGKGAVKRARADAAANHADLILWGADVRGDEVQMRLATADAARAPVMLAFGGAKSHAEGTGRLTQEVGDAIAFFAAEAAGKAPADLNTLKATALVALAEKLAGLITGSPKGLSETQRKTIAESFDPIGFAAIERAFPSDAVIDTLLALRKAKAQASGGIADCLAWAEVAAITGGAAVNEALARLPQLAAGEADPALKAAALALQAVLAIRAGEFRTAREAAGAALKLNPPGPVAARAQTVLSAAYGKLALASEGQAGLDLLDQARAAGAAAMTSADPALLKIWLDAHLNAAQAARFAIGRSHKAGDGALREEAEAALEAALAPAGGAALPDAPKATVRCAIERCYLVRIVTGYAPASAQKALMEANLSAANVARRLLPAGRAPVFAAELALSAGEALQRLGEWENSPTRLAAAIKACVEAAAFLLPATDEAARAWAVAASARVSHGNVLLRQPSVSAAQTAKARADAAQEAAAAIETLTQKVAPFMSRAAEPQAFAVLQDRLGRAFRLEAELAGTAPVAAAAYLNAAAHFRASAEALAAINNAQFAERNTREAAECENLAAGEAQAGG
jgi:hypothetical protein